MTALSSLRDHVSRRPHHHPQSAHLKKSADPRLCVAQSHSGLVVFWVKLIQRGYKRSIPELYRFLKKQRSWLKTSNPKYIPKPYEQMKYPGQRIQVDVKFVPACCLVNNAKERNSIQYTPLMSTPAGGMEGFEEHSTYSSAQFLKHLIPTLSLCQSNAFQTDNSVEFTKRFSTSGKNIDFIPTDFKRAGIQHKLIRPFTPSS